MYKLAKFNIGDAVLHVEQGYQALIVDVDPIFQASGRFNPQALKRDFAHRNPWYRLLVQNTELLTYAEETKLVSAEIYEIKNPLLSSYLLRDNNRYVTVYSKH